MQNEKLNLKEDRAYIFLLFIVGGWSRFGGFVGLISHLGRLHFTGGCA